MPSRPAGWICQASVFHHLSSPCLSNQTFLHFHLLHAQRHLPPIFSVWEKIINISTYNFIGYYFHCPWFFPDLVHSNLMSINLSLTDTSLPVKASSFFVCPQFWEITVLSWSKLLTTEIAETYDIPDDKAISRLLVDCNKNQWWVKKLRETHSLREVIQLFHVS